MYIGIRSISRVIKCEYRMMSNIPKVQMYEHENVVTEKLNSLINWYEHITGMNEVRAAQNRVLEQEKKLAHAQDNRREVNKLVTAVQTKLRELHAALDSTPRGEDRYVGLITQEHNLLKEEHKLIRELQQYEGEEREYFTALSSAVKTSHEKERAQAERTKYWSIIGSIIGTVLGIVGSTINNNFKFKKFERMVKESVGVNMDSHIPQQQEQQLNLIVAHLKTCEGYADKTDKILRLLAEHQIGLEKQFKELEELLKKVFSPFIKDWIRSTPSECVESDVPVRDEFIKSFDSTPFREVNIKSWAAVGVIGFVAAAICSCCCR